MIYAIDTEFNEDGGEKPITLISIALVAEDGRAFYAVSTGFDPLTVNPWVRKHVLPLLPPKDATGEDGRPIWKSRAEIRRGIEEFIGADPHPALVGSYADYDHVVFCQVWGALVDLPPRFPRWCWDCRQEQDRLGVASADLPRQDGPEHDALADATHTLAVYRFLADRAFRAGGGR